jgi:hypothetical protein
MRARVRASVRPCRASRAVMREREREEKGVKGFGFLLAGGDRKP